MSRYSEACSSILDHFNSGSSPVKEVGSVVITELVKLVAYESKFEQAKVSLRRTRNQNPDLVPINKLPTEIMVHIFRFLCSSGGCFLPADYSPRRERQVIYPDALLRVCSSWRQIVFTSHVLWTHIDLDDSETTQLRQAIFTRAKNFVGRSGRAPLHFHLRVGLSRAEDDLSPTKLFQSIAPRIRAFSFECIDARLEDDVKQALLGTLSETLPGTLTQLCIRIRGHYPAFLVPFSPTHSSAPSNYPFFTISLTEGQFEELLAPVTRLELEDLYPAWTSRAYCGLVELALTSCTTSKITITDSELTRILRASPGLQVFRFGLKVTLEPRKSPTITQLNCLRLFDLDATGDFPPEAIFRMIQPGRLPLETRIEIDHWEGVDFISPSWAEFASFAARSSIYRLNMSLKGERFYSSELFSVLPQLEELLLQRSVLGQTRGDITCCFTFQDVPRHRLRLLILIDCVIHLNDFRDMSEIQPTDRLVLQGCRVIETYDTLSHVPKTGDSPNGWQKVLSRICPSVEIINTSSTFEEANWESFRSVSVASGDTIWD
ncbi:unnamed protein product [Rhizoctonia solani]|uniref:F-box domain-containing protein n=1 Tax=Rhizoctonia solani TaxID=456999 RepID=A0A8H3D2M6_9AGAM|nr:unnamed protein product [Rhizoctonia solani]